MIVAHLGNGASLCAMHDGRSFDTTMGFTALDGLMMGTRCGALDPGVILYLTATRPDPEAGRGSALQAIGPARRLRRNCKRHADVCSRVIDPRADEAIELFVFRIVREIGALTSSLGGLDGLVFTAGHRRACAGDSRAGLRNGLAGSVLFSMRKPMRVMEMSSARPQSRVAVRVIPTNEEAMIARHTLDTVKQAAPVS